VTNAQYPYALHHFTERKEHNIAMRGRAVRMGIKMNEYGLFRGEELIPCRDETEIFAAVGLEFVPPEMREDQGEIEAALHGGVPKNLLVPTDLKGALHVHTTASDGRDGLESLVTGAIALGWEYIGISDHAAGSLRRAGLDAAQFAAQRREVEKLDRGCLRFTSCTGSKPRSSPTVDSMPTTGCSPTAISSSRHSMPASI
jgi:DNA polymerase (family 10)